MELFKWSRDGVISMTRGQGHMCNIIDKNRRVLTKRMVFTSCSRRLRVLPDLTLVYVAWMVVVIMRHVPTGPRRDGLWELE